jgi:hypothetical protein
MNKKEYVADKTIEAMLQTSASDIEDKMVDDLLEGFEGQVHDFSQKHNEVMRRLFKEEQKSQLYQRMRTYSRRAAVILVAVITLSAVAISSVSALRVRFMNFILERTQYDTDIKFTDNTPPNADNYKFGEIIMEYIPEGFKLENSQIQEKHLNLTFKKNNESFNLHTRDIGSSLSIDTENAVVKELTIHGREALYSENDNIHILVWNDDETAYILTGNISESEFIKIAENIKR